MPDLNNPMSGGDFDPDRLDRYKTPFDNDPDLIDRGAIGGRRNAGHAAAQERNARRQRQPAAEDVPQRAQRRVAEAAAPRPQRRVKEPAKPRRPFREWGIVRFLCDRRFHAVVGVALVFLAVYIAIAAISFVRNGADDQSLVNTMHVSQIVNSGEKTGNAAGPVGAQLAQSMFVEGLGIGSVALIFYLGLVGLGLMGFRKNNFWSLTFKTLLVSIAVSIVFGLVSLWFNLDVNLGGYHGKYINVALIGYLDWVGAALMSLLLLVTVFYVYINDLMRLYNRYRSVRQAQRDRAEQRRLEIEADRRRVREAMAQADSEENPPVEPVEQHAGNPDGGESAADGVEPVSLGFEDAPAPEHDIYAIDTTDDYAVAPEEPLAEEPVASSEPVAEPVVTLAERMAGKVQQPTETEDFIPAAHADVVEDVAAEAPQPAEGPSLEVVTNKIEKAEKVNECGTFDPTAELSRYVMPGLDLLRDIAVKTNSVDLEEQEENKDRITKTLNDYGIAISHIHATVGPTVTLYEIIPAEGVRIAKIKRLEDDIAMSLAALGIRIIAPIPGKGTIGIEVPNKDPQTVSIRSILGSKKFQECKYELPMAMGATIANDVYIADLCKMPHLLVAGATGMGKSVGLNTIIASLLYKKHPAELKFVLIDPKMVEFSLYSVLERHYLAKLPDEEEAVVTSMDKVLATLNSLCVEMDQRYLLLRDANERTILDYNKRFMEKRLNPEKGHRYLPYIVMIVDEFADLIMTAGKEVEKPIARIAQKARAVGMHMIIATQRPSTNVITGLIKANFPGRIAFRVSQMVDSKTILDRTGANQLIGRGDMLFSHNGSLERVQCAFIDTPEVQAICSHIDRQAGFEHAYYLPEPQMEPETAGGVGALTDRDPLFEEAAEIVVSAGLASTSSLQRRYSIGYNRAGKIMDQLEAAGIVGPSQGGKPRNVLVDSIQLGSILRSNDDNSRQSF